MMKESWPRWLLLFSLAINVGVMCTAAYVHYFVGPRPFVVHFAEKRIMLDDPKLNLSEDQRKEFQRLQKRFLSKIESDFPEFHGKRMEMINALAAPALDELRIHRSAGSVRDFQNKFHEEWVGYLVSLRLVLTPEQQEVFGQVLRERLEFPLKAPGRSDPPIALQK